MQPLSAGLGYVDLHFRGQPQIIATAVAQSPEGVALIDPGPTSCLPALTAALATRGYSLGDVRALLLTHIHLDHAGASGTIVRAHPDVRVFVHEAGAPHLADPSKLVASASRLYGDAMDRLWGAVDPVPRDRIETLAGGERLAVAGRDLEVAYTPGHASHHVSYFDRATRIVFAGDTAGIRRGVATFVLPPTPPPDIDLERWEESLQRIERWRPDAVFITHFGPHHDVPRHLAELRIRLHELADLVRGLLRSGASNAEQRAAYATEIRRMLRQHMTDADVQRYETAGAFDFSFSGLARYLSRRGLGQG